jgi:hypothetical protein
MINNTIDTQDSYFKFESDSPHVPKTAEILTYMAECLIDKKF